MLFEHGQSLFSSPNPKPLQQYFISSHCGNKPKVSCFLMSKGRQLVEQRGRVSRGEQYQAWTVPGYGLWEERVHIALSDLNWGAKIIMTRTRTNTTPPWEACICKCTIHVHVHSVIVLWTVVFTCTLKVPVQCSLANWSFGIDDLWGLTRVMICLGRMLSRKLMMVFLSLSWP